MRNAILSGAVALICCAPAVAQVAQERIFFEESRDGYFNATVRYTQQTDGREHCSAEMLDRQTESSVSLLVPGDSSEVGVIIVGLPRPLFGIGGQPEAVSLRFRFSDENGQMTPNSALGYWDYRVEEAHQGSRLSSFVLLTRVEDLWGFARDWHDSGSITIENGESGETMGSMTLHRAMETMLALADCWTQTAD